MQCILNIISYKILAQNSQRTEGLPIKIQHIQSQVKFAAAHMDEPNSFSIEGLWSYESEIELSGHNRKNNILRDLGEAFKVKNNVPSMKHRGGSIMLMTCFAASSTGAFPKYIE